MRLPTGRRMARYTREPAGRDGRPTAQCPDGGADSERAATNTGPGQGAGPREPFDGQPLGTRDELLKLIEAAFESTVFVRGNEITITGEQTDAERVARLFEELIALLERGDALTADTVGRSIDIIRDDGATRPPRSSATRS